MTVTAEEAVCMLFLTFSVVLGANPKTLLQTVANIIFVRPSFFLTPTNTITMITIYTNIIIFITGVFITTTVLLLLLKQLTCAMHTYRQSNL